MNSKKTFFKWQKLLIIFLLGCTIIAAIFRCEYKITDNHITVIRESLKTQSNEEEVQISTTIEQHMKSLEGVSREISVCLERGDSLESILNFLDPVRELYGLRRIGVLDKDGNATTTDGYSDYLGFRDFFQKGLEGKTVVTGVLQDMLSGDEKHESSSIMVISVPIFSSENDVIGVLFATYGTDNLYAEMDLDSTDHMTHGFILDGNSVSLVAKDLHQEALGCLLDDGKLFNVAKNQSPDEVLIVPYKCSKHKYDGYATLNRIQLCQEEESDWFLLSFVSKDLLNADIEADVRDIRRMLTVVLVTTLAAFLYFGVTTHREFVSKTTEIEKASYHDFLTNGDNYLGFCQKLSMEKQSRFVISEDIIQFNVINTVCGTSRGDEILVRLYECIREFLGPDELVGHLSGDSFVFTMTGHSEDQIGMKLKELQQQTLILSEKESVPDMIPCFGISFFDPSEDPKEVINRANIAKQKNKDREGHLFSFYSEEDDLQQVKEKNMLDSFGQALDADRFVVWFQPQFSSRRGDINGAEALVRLVNKRGSYISPAEFIPVFEKHGRIGELDRFVFETVCKRLNKMKKDGKRIIPISVNLSRASLYRENLISDYLQILKKYELSPSLIPLEITESAVADERHIRNLTRELKENGFTLFMDDFGSGYSSLVDLGMMQFDVIKLDRKLIGQIGSPNGERILRHTIQMARELKLHLVAEGVETKEQQEFLNEYGVDKIQGFYYSKPLPDEAFGVLCEKYLIQEPPETPARLNLLDSGMLHSFFNRGHVEYSIAEKMNGAYCTYVKVQDRFYLHSVNDEFIKLFETSFGNLENLHLENVLMAATENTRAAFQQLFDAASNVPDQLSQERICFVTETGKRVWCCVEMVWMNFLSNPGQQYFLASFTNVTVQVQMEELLSTMPGGLFAYKAEGDEELLFINDEAVHIFGCENEAELRRLTGNSFKGMLYPEDLEWVEDSIHRQIQNGSQNLDAVSYRIVRKDGKSVWINDYGRYVSSELLGNVFYVFISDSFLDRGELNETQEMIMTKLNQLKYDSTHDKLTGFFNQQSAKDEIDRILESNQDHSFALVAYDLDDFKKINDSYGHEYGNEVLQKSSALFQKSFPEALLFARMGGDEFLMLFELNERLTAESLVSRLRQKTHWRIDEKLIRTSMGVVFSDDVEKSRRAMCLAADETMYQIKRTGKNGLRIYQNGVTADIYQGIIKAEVQENEGVIEQYCRFIDSVQDLSEEYMYILDFENDFYYISPKAEKRFKMKSHHFNVAAEGHRDFVFEFDYPHLRKELESLVEEKREKHDMVYRWILKDGTPIWIHCHGAVHMKNGAPWFMLGFISEIHSQ